MTEAKKTCVSLRVTLWSQVAFWSHLQIGDSRLKKTVIKPQPSDPSGGLDIEVDDTTASSTPPTPRRRHHLDDSFRKSSRKNRSPSTRLGFGQLSVAKLGPNCLWDLAKRADPVPAKAPVESGEPDVQCLLILINT